MTLFIYEHLTSGALLNEPFSPGLMHEGDAMLTALSQDLLALAQRVTVMRDARLPELPSHPLLSVQKISTSGDYQQYWQQSLQQHEQIVLIAPETDGVLYQLACQLEQQPIHHLGCSTGAIQLCSDKLLTSQQLLKHSILTPATQTAEEWLKSEHNDDRFWVIKPRDGAGCEHTYKLHSADLHQYVSGLTIEQQSAYIIQPYIDGDTLSLSLFIGDTETDILSVNRQGIKETHHQLSLNHCEPGYDHLLPPGKAQALVEQIHATIPGLRGFVGIDLILSDDQVWVIEINPRLTSSYAEPGFRLHRNPALALHQSLQA
jgi:predicted ATP-grasp superfamily ATP-dependent carboligase